MLNTYAKTFKQNENAEGFNFVVDTDEVYNTAGDGYWSDVEKDVRVTQLGIYISFEGDGEYYNDGDFYVNYDEATWDNSEDGLIYTDSAFLSNVQDKMRDVLLQMGVDDVNANELSADISYSEQGMQDDGRVSFDAYALADFLRKFYNTALA